ncbi:MAG: phosphoglucosamine mutase [Candidatus Thermoplasmatota archaeon]|jgi:phosphomannomutase/phosphoglucomutase|nr:phosphoglucosamine mutase [Candidatus Thermoplasmatota archaeon]MCL5962888.1 phosphoglucosamine mutase [Candidatus Thermoplasmatota archaeon]
MKKLFGTNGIRGIVNKELNVEFISKIAEAIGTWYGKNSWLAIGTDARTSSDAVKRIVTGSLCLTGINVIDLGMVPTPAIQLFIKNHKLAGGVIITASHNPPEFNGIKCISSTGMELSETDEEAIESIYFDGKSVPVEWNETGLVRNTDTAAQEYIASIVKHTESEHKKRKLLVVIDSANSVGSVTSPHIVERLGHIPVTINSNIQGSFPGRNPEPVKENLSNLIKMVKSINADLGVAHDGDADRAIFIDNEGNFIAGEVALATIAYDIIKRRGSGIFVTPVSTSSIVERYISSAGGVTRYSKIGAPAVSSLMIELNALFGGEENGGMIYPEHLYARDGGMTLAYMLKILSEGDISSKELFDRVPSVGFSKMKVHCDNSKKSEVMKRMEIESNGLKIDKTDGLKLFIDTGWVLVRASGTEPIIRVYVESTNEKSAMAIAEEYVKKIDAFIMDTGHS